MVGAATDPDRVFVQRSEPGCVLRVSRRWTPKLATAATNWLVSVAMPDMRCRKFSAVRSPVMRLRAGPCS